MAATTRVGRYEVLFRIAGGGMAEVFAARVRGEAGFEKLVAVKRVLPHLSEEASIAKMFLDEARVAANISSPHVVSTLDLGRTDDGTPFLVMELVLGVDLSEIMKLTRRAERLVPLDVAIEILAQAAVGLHAAHEARTPSGEPLMLVHRDVSPQNLLVGADGRVRLTDFGIAWAAFERFAETTNGTYKGKYAYFSPEQSRRAKLDRRSDVFALGIVAWEVIAGRRLFARDDVILTIEAIRRGDVPSLCEREEVGPALDDVVQRALAVDPSERFPTARAFADALRSAARAQGLEPSDADVARYVAELAPPRLAALETRLKQLASSPGVETLPDIESASEAEAPHTRLIGVRDAGSDPAATAPSRIGPAKRWRIFAIAAAAVSAAALAIGAGLAFYEEEEEEDARAAAVAPVEPEALVAAPAPQTPAVVAAPPPAVTVDAGVAEPPAPRRRTIRTAARQEPTDRARPFSVDAFDRGARRAPR